MLTYIQHANVGELENFRSPDHAVNSFEKKK